jgi:hypothetical protein
MRPATLACDHRLPARLLLNATGARDRAGMYAVTASAWALLSFVAVAAGFSGRGTTGGWRTCARRRGPKAALPSTVCLPQQPAYGLLCLEKEERNLLLGCMLLPFLPGLLGCRMALMRPSTV